MKKKPTTQSILLKAFRARKNNAAALAAVAKVHPRTSMTLPTVNWYRNRYRKAGEKIPSEHELR